MMEDFKQQAASAVAKVAPPAGASFWLYLGLHMDDWIKLATLVYIVVQISALVVTKYFLWTGKLHGVKSRICEDDDDTE